MIKELSVIRTEKLFLLIGIAVILLYGAIRYVHLPITDTAYFGGDIWEYQSMGVNFAMGHGFQLFGEVEQFETYKFDPRPDNEPYHDKSYYKGFKKPQLNFFRAPAYTFFLGTIYSVFGVRPSVVKKIQYLLILVGMLILPIIGFLYWGTVGTITGTVAACYCLIKEHFYANEIMTEPLILLGVSLIILCFSIFEKKPSSKTACVLGVVNGIGLLMKASFIFFPVLIFFLLLLRVIKQKATYSYLAAFTIPVFVIVLSYSLWASYKAHRPILISSREVLLLDGYNEKALVTGGWEPYWWQTDPSSFYNKPEIKNLPTVKKVTLFLAEHHRHVPLLLVKRMRAGFGHIHSVFMLLMFLPALMGIYVFKEPSFNRRDRRIGISISIISLSVALIVWPVMTLFYYSTVIMILFSLFSLINIIIIAGISVSYFRKSMSGILPAPILIGLINISIVILIFFGVPRFTLPFKPFIHMVAVNTAALIILECFKFKISIIDELQNS